MNRDLSVIGHALAAPVRSTMLNLLMDGSQRPASELSTAAGVSASTASEHLRVLLDAGLIRCMPHGRHRFYALADEGVASALEQLGHLCPSTEPISYRQSRDARGLAQARLCYDHLAGQLDQIVEFVAGVSEVAADDVPPMSHPLPLANVTRPDEVRPSLTAEQALAGAPDQEEQRFQVPRILDEE